MTDTNLLLEKVLVFGLAPLWLLAGLCDWLCHRVSRIERTSGAGESALHLLLFAEIALPFALTLWLEVSAGLLLILGLAVAAHMLTSWWDTAFAQPRRQLSPIEQQVHSWLEMLPLFALVLLALIHSQELVAPRWGFFPREAPLPSGFIATVLCALGVGGGFILEEWLRGIRQRLVNAAASAPAAGPRR